MAEREQVRPLAPAGAHPSSSDEDDTALHHQTLIRRRKFIKRCASLLAFTTLLLAIVITVLIFTVFRVKDPIIRMNGIKITSTSVIPNPGVNMSLIADVSVKNPNVASFRYSNTTTTIYYHGSMVGEARGPPGRAKARRTMRMNITVDIIMDRVMASPDLRSDLGSGLLTMGSYSRVPGQVKILNLFKKHVVVKMNCTITFSISNQAIQEQKCRRKVKL